MIQAVTCDLFLYADDSALVVSGTDPRQIEITLAENLKSLSYWLEENKLSLHLGKTESILFATKKKLSKCNRLNIMCNNKEIESKSSIKYLGVTFDQDFSGLSMASLMLKKINAKFKFLYRIICILGLKRENY